MKTRIIMVHSEKLIVTKDNSNRQSQLKQVVNSKSEFHTTGRRSMANPETPIRLSRCRWITMHLTSSRCRNNSLWKRREKPRLWKRQIQVSWILLLLKILNQCSKAPVMMMEKVASYANQRSTDKLTMKATTKANSTNSSILKACDAKQRPISRLQPPAIREGSSTTISGWAINSINMINYHLERRVETKIKGSSLIVKRKCARGVYHILKRDKTIHNQTRTNNICKSTRTRSSLTQPKSIL